MTQCLFFSAFALATHTKIPEAFPGPGSTLETHLAENPAVNCKVQPSSSPSQGLLVLTPLHTLSTRLPLHHPLLPCPLNVILFRAFLLLCPLPEYFPLLLCLGARSGSFWPDKAHDAPCVLSSSITPITVDAHTTVYLLWKFYNGEGC